MQAFSEELREEFDDLLCGSAISEADEKTAYTERKEELSELTARGMMLVDHPSTAPRLDNDRLGFKTWSFEVRFTETKDESGEMISPSSFG